MRPGSSSIWGNLPACYPTALCVPTHVTRLVGQLLFLRFVPDTYANSPVSNAIFRVINNFPPVLSKFATIRGARSRGAECKDQLLLPPTTVISTPNLVKYTLNKPESLYCFCFVLQDWLTESARLISKSGHTVEWVTPLGLPIVQPYHRTRNQVVSPIFLL